MIERVLPVVVRIERAAPPGRTDALEAAATAVLRLLCVAERQPGWAEPVAEWERGRIRKVVRRARGARWGEVLGLPGFTVTLRTAEVRVHPPVPLDGWPPELARLQVSGTDLPDAAPPPEPGPGVPVLWINPALDMTAGKAMAQVGHGAQVAWWATGESERAVWRARGLAVAVRTANPDRWPELAGCGLPMVRDAGFTEIEPGSTTVVAELPWSWQGVPEV